jgi:Chaperone of endosialidase
MTCAVPELQRSPELLERIARVRVVSWEWNETAASFGLTAGGRAIGVIAQEIAEIFPELVVSSADDEYLRVDYGGLAAIAIAGLQRLQLELDTIRGQLPTSGS